MEQRHIDEYLLEWRRFIEDIIKESQELDDTKEEQIRDIVEDMERDVEKHLDRMKDVVRG